MRGRQQAARGVMLDGSAAGLCPLDRRRVAGGSNDVTPLWIATDNPTPFGSPRNYSSSAGAGNYSL